MPDLLVGRQPIFNRKLDVVAYELLYRSVGQGNKANFLDGDQATTQVILNTFSEVGLETLVGQSVAYINCTRNFLIGKYPIPLPPARVVLEVLEDIVIDPPLIDALRTLGHAGFTIALDDVVSAKMVLPLIGLAKIVKVDIMGMDPKVLQNIAMNLKQYNILLLAEKVETQQEYDFCYRLGFDLFQGYFLCKPSVIKGRKLDALRLVVLRSLAKLQEPKTNFQEMEIIIAQDVTLGYKLLKLINSGYYSLITDVKSIRQAISMIGINQLRAWMTLLLMATVEGKPHELTSIAMQRAKLCEMFAKAKNLPQPETYFLVGLLSVLDALMDMPMDQVLANVPVSNEIAGALLNHTGDCGLILKIVIAYEQGDWETVLKINLHSEIIRNIYLNAIQWTAFIINDMRSSIQRT